MVVSSHLLCGSGSENVHAVAVLIFISLALQLAEISSGCETIFQ